MGGGYKKCSTILAAALYPLLALFSIGLHKMDFSIGSVILLLHKKYNRMSQSRKLLKLFIKFIYVLGHVDRTKYSLDASSTR